MEFFDLETGRARRTLDEFLGTGETYGHIIFSGVVHKFKKCIHVGVGSKGSLPNCNRISTFSFLEHQICEFCEGVERYPEGWAQKVTRVLSERRDDEELLDLLIDEILDLSPIMFRD